MKRHLLFLLLAIAGITAQAQAPAGYYDNANGKTGTELRAALHDIIKGHTSISYQQIWSAFWTTDNKGNNVVWDMYSDGANYTYYYTNGNDQCGEYEQEGDCYNREHSWPKSWFSGDEQTVPGRDLHHIFPTDGYVNSERGNFPFGEVGSGNVTTFKNGSKLGYCKTTLGYTGKVYEPIDEYKGDFARTYFYMSTRYYTEDSGWGSSGMTNKSDLKEWAINMLLNWSDNDPVSQKEIDRNNAVYGIQGNRNPFIDHPEYAHIIWEEGWNGVTYNIACAQVYHGTITAPSSAVEGTIVTLTATPAAGYMLDSWSVYKTGDTSTTVSVSDNGTFTMPAFNVTVSATFVQNSTPYSITCTSGLANGSVSANVSSATSGSTITLSNTPASGYVLYSYYVYKTGDLNTIVYSGTGSTFTMPAYNVTVSASFVQPSSYSYVKVTSAPSDWSGEYLLVYENSATSAYVWTGVDDASCYTEKTITNNSIADDDVVSMTIASMSGGYSIKVNSGTNKGKYIYGTSGSNKINFGTSASLNTLAFETEGVKITSNTSVMRFNNNSGQMRFRYFKSDTYTNQQYIQLYKKTGNSAAPTHTIQFMPNGASGTSRTQTVNEFESTALDANTFTRSGYAFSSWNTQSDGSGTTYFDGAIVTLLNDLTLYAQWVPTYSIACATTVEHGTISASAAEAAEGDVVTLTANPETGYELDAWVVINASNNEPITVTDNHFEMPAANVTVTASFAYVGQPFAQQYYQVTSTDQLVAGRTYLIVNASAQQAMSTTQNTNNRGAASVSVSNSVISSIGTDVCELTLGGATGAWTLYDANKSGYLYAAGGTGNNNYLKTQSTLTDEGKWSIAISNGNATIKTIVSTVARHTIMYNNSSKLFSCYASGQQAVQLYIRAEEYDHIEDETIAHLFKFDKHTIQRGATLTVTGTATCNDAGHLILEDGAQLIHYTADVQATFKKRITGYTDDGGWFTIATPFTSMNPSGTIATNDYDLYYYDEDGNSEGKEWINYKAGSFNLVAGKGYLYAHNPSTTLRMTGALNAGNYTDEVSLSYNNSDSGLKGFNLLGNPTAHEIEFTTSAGVSYGYYYLNNSGNWTYNAGNTVPAGRGFLVKANGTGQTVTLNPQAKRGGEIETVSTPSLLCIDVDGERTYVKMNEGVNMPLLDFRGRHSSVYLTRDHQPYIMLVRDGAEAIDLCYQPQHSGQHQLSVSMTTSEPLTSHLSPSYLHLIDRLTGADIDLLQTPTYSFDSKESDYASRFRLVFSASNDAIDAKEDDNFAFISDGQLMITGEGTLQIFDALGRQLFAKQVSPLTSHLSPLTSPGVYVLRLVTPEKVMVQKMVIH